MRRELVDQRAVDFRAEAVDGGFASRRDAIDGAGLGDDGARDGEVAFRRQEFGDRRRTSRGAGRRAPPSVHRRPSSIHRRRRDDRRTSRRRSRRHSARCARSARPAAGPCRSRCRRRPPPSFVQPPPRNRSSSGAVHGETSTPRMLRGRPSPLRPQRSMATAWLTPARARPRSGGRGPRRRRRPLRRPPRHRPLRSTAARTAPAQGVSTAMRAGTPQAASAAASRAVPTGPSVSGAATSPRGTKKPVIRPTRVAPPATWPPPRVRPHWQRSAPGSCARHRGRPAPRWRRCAGRTHFSLATYTPVQSGGESSIRPSTRTRIMS